jgi:porin
MLWAAARQVGARQRAVGCGRRAVWRLAAALCDPFSLLLPLLLLPLLSLPVLWPTSARAIDTLVAPTSQAQRSFAELWNDVTDPYGARSRLEEAGVKFTFTYYGDALGNPTGGVYQGMGYSGRFATIVDVDLEKIVGWSGATFHVSEHQIHGPGLSSNYLDNLLVVSGIEALGSTRLFNLWIEQKFGTQANLRVGQFSAGQEFMVSEYANLYVNASFGWPGLASQDMPSGGSTYPEGTPGVRLEIAPDDPLSLLVAVFDGNPAGQGYNNPITRDPSGVLFRTNDPAFFIAEINYDYNQDKVGGLGNDPNQEGTQGRAIDRRASGASGLPGTVKFGAWANGGVFPDERINTLGGLLGVVGGQPLPHRGNYAVYGVIDQILWRPGGGDRRELDFFLRASAAPSDRNLIDAYFDAGLNLKAPFESRPDDVLGLAFAYARISPKASAAQRDLQAATGSPMPIEDFEAAIELTYKMQLAKGLWFQPDLQYIIHPGGNIPDPVIASGTVAIPNAFVVGARTLLRF